MGKEEMSISSEDPKLGAILYDNVSRGFRRTFLYLGVQILFALLVLTVIKSFEEIEEYKIQLFVGVALFWLAGSGVILFKMVSDYRKSILCPRCGQPYNIGAFGNVPFAKKCQ